MPSFTILEPKERPSLTKKHTHQYFIEGEFPTLNQYISAERSSKFRAADLKKVFTQVTQYSVEGEDPVDLRFPCCASFVWYRANLMTDLDNISFGQKFVLDGLVNAGIIPDDNLKHIIEIRHKVVLRPDNTGVEITFSETTG